LQYRYPTGNTHAWEHFVASPEASPSPRSKLIIPSASIWHIVQGLVEASRRQTGYGAFIPEQLVVLANGKVCKPFGGLAVSSLASDVKYCIAIRHFSRLLNRNTEKLAI
jgi:hypothetical protein